MHPSKLKHWSIDSLGEFMSLAIEGDVWSHFKQTNLCVARHLSCECRKSLKYLIMIT